MNEAMNEAMSATLPPVSPDFALGRMMRRGAQTGFLSALLYGALATLAIGVRSSLQILSVLSLDEGLLPTLAANGFGLLWPCLITTLLLGAIAALVGVVTGWAVYALSHIGPGPKTPRQTATLGFGVPALMLLLINLLVIQGIGGYWGAFWPQGYLFWVGLPSLVFVAATAWACRRA